MGRRRKRSNSDNDESLEQSYNQSQPNRRLSVTENDESSIGESDSAKKAKTSLEKTLVEPSNSRAKESSESVTKTDISEKEKQRIERLQKKKKHRKEQKKAKALTKQETTVTQSNTVNSAKERKPKDSVDKKDNSNTEFKTMAKGVQYRDVVIGKGPSVQERKKIRVTYILRAIHRYGKILDSSNDFKFRIGRGEVVKGWDIGIMGMRQGGKRYLIVPPNAGYGGLNRYLTDHAGATQSFCNDDLARTLLSPIQSREIYPDMDPTPNATAYEEMGGELSEGSGIAAQPRKQSHAQKVANSLHGVVVPKAEPIKWYHFLALSLYIAIPVIAYVMVFTTMGFGGDLFFYVADKYGEYSMMAIAATVGVTFVAYMLDFTDWRSNTGVVLQKMVWAFIVVGVIAFTLLMVNEYPYGPIAVFAFITPMYLVAIKGICYSDLETKTFISWLSGPLFFVALVNGIIWIIWTFREDKNEYNEYFRVNNAEEAGCPAPDFNEYPNCDSLANPGTLCVTVFNNEFVFEKSADDGTYCPVSCTEIYDDCLNIFILWVGPPMFSMVLIFLSFFATFLRAGNGEKDMLNFGKVWMFLLFATWLTASLAGIAAGVASALMALTLASFIGSAVFIASSVSYDEGKTQAKGFWEKIKEKYGENMMNVLRGLGIITLTPAFLIFLVLSMLNQCVRRCGLPCSKKMKTDKERSDFITKRARRAIDTYLTWDRSTVFTYAVYWGAAFMILQVIVSQFTVLFLSWLIEATAPLGLGPVTGIMVGVGLVMFLLPPVPGVPIYLTLGIVVLATGRDTLGVVGCVGYGCGVSIVLKLLACTMQQKLIGEQLSNYVAVRQLVGINSSVIRAMKLILQEPGFSVPKVAILIGGPDWPTSVLCGLMRLQLLPILIGTIPVIFLIVPTLLTGTFTYMSSLTLDDGTPEFAYAGVLATVFAAITAIVQFGSMVVAAYYLEQTASAREEELAQIPIDQEVKEREQKDDELRRCYKEVTKWEIVPFIPKMILRLAVVTMIGSCYMVQLFASSSFAEYELTYTIDNNLDGDWTNLLLPLGRIASLLFVISSVLVYGYVKWAGHEARKMMAYQDAEAPSQTNTQSGGNRLPEAQE
ncbi:unnamed protein product [Cylindrotheca closterium]|uniref:peptidylprolyl isomerase n=1 Tax=Cylindrotheca closterium TaxID=2856 RepID=A0AAD2FE50_9STRA|nr:unnamed protein product [Cylindrotheca closterium]